jgi:uncharacterized flavoprotein (TIGR03862 family)
MPTAAIIGGGPAGLIAAETLARAGVAVTVYDQMATPGRKLLIAGRGGLNLTHSEPLETFLDRYGTARARLEPAIRAFPPAALIDWAQGLGVPTFTGSSGRVFPVAMKAAPLLRAWLRRLADLGVTLRTRHRWVDWGLFGTPDGPLRITPDVTVLACGGASWPRMGSDGAWIGWVPDTVPFRPSNCGFLAGWSPAFAARFAGQPLKRIAVSLHGQRVRGEAMLTAAGIEGGAIYALSAAIRDAIAAGGPVTVTLDLRPDIDAGVLAGRVDGPRGGQSLSNWLRKRATLSPAAIGLVQEALHGGAGGTPLSTLVKALPLRLTAPMPMARAISVAGGVRLDALDDAFMLRGRPGVFAAGEMLDWEAPTGGYLLQASFATGVAAARGALRWLGRDGTMPA